MGVSSNATELYANMWWAVTAEAFPRQASDPESLQQKPTYEARPGQEFELRFPEYNLVVGDIDTKWAVAGTMHFFAGTEEAEMLRNFNPNADKFLVDGQWIGAYGAIAMPQIRECIARLKEHPWSRRAIVSMGGTSPQDMHRPACWSFLQFLRCRNGLYLLAYQRSLNLQKIMPYDLIVLSNALLYVARETELPVGSLMWTVGSLHVLNLEQPPLVGHRHISVVVKTPPEKCLAVLRDPEQYREEWMCVSYK